MIFAPNRAIDEAKKAKEEKRKEDLAKAAEERRKKLEEKKEATRLKREKEKEEKAAKASERPAATARGRGRPRVNTADAPVLSSSAPCPSSPIAGPSAAPAQASTRILRSRTTTLLPRRLSTPEPNEEPDLIDLDDVQISGRPMRQNEIRDGEIGDEEYVGFSTSPPSPLAGTPEPDFDNGSDQEGDDGEMSRGERQEGDDGETSGGGGRGDGETSGKKTGYAAAEKLGAPQKGGATKNGAARREGDRFLSEADVIFAADAIPDVSPTRVIDITVSPRKTEAQSTTNNAPQQSNEETSADGKSKTVGSVVISPRKVQNPSLVPGALALASNDDGDAPMTFEELQSAVDFLRTPTRSTTDRSEEEVPTAAAVVDVVEEQVDGDGNFVPVSVTRVLVENATPVKKMSSREDEDAAGSRTPPPLIIDEPDALRDMQKSAATGSSGAARSTSAKKRTPARTSTPRKTSSASKTPQEDPALFDEFLATQATQSARTKVMTWKRNAMECRRILKVSVLFPFAVVPCVRYCKNFGDVSKFVH